MPRSENVLQVFVASPSDVREEREILESTIQELNKTWSKTLGVRLELLRWETDTRPAIGNDAQGVINSQIGDEYDIFIGIVWGRIGTPTPRSESGTLEEFDRARSRWSNNPDSIEIMIYFKDAPIRPSESDGAQSDKVQKFKQSLGEEGVYHWTFEGADNFESLIRAHLSSVAQQWAFHSTQNLSENQSQAGTRNIARSNESDDDLGFLDYVDHYNFSMEQMNAAIHAVADATLTVGEHMSRRTSELKGISDLNDPQGYKEARRTIKSSATDMDKYAGILEHQLPLMSSSRKEAFEALSKALSMFEDFDNNKSDIDHLDDSLREMIDAAGGGLESMITFRESVSNLPRLTVEINKAKRKVIKALDKIVTEVETTINTANNLLDTLP